MIRLREHPADRYDFNLGCEYELKPHITLLTGVYSQSKYSEVSSLIPSCEGCNFSCGVCIIRAISVMCGCPFIV